jgi:succinyl-diaminopimelate desuccinylase
VSQDSLLGRISGDVDRDRDTIVDFMVKMLKIKAINPRSGGPGESKRADLIENYLKDEGFTVSRVDVPDAASPTGSRPNLIVKLDGQDKSKTLWYAVHMDTVTEGSRDLWKTDPFDPVVKDGKIFARGSIDDGQPLVAALFALRELKKIGAKLPFNVGVAFVSDEETGSDYGAKYLLSHNYFGKKDLFIVPDDGSPDGVNVELAEKSMLWVKVTVIGKQVHASLPRKGLNAHRIGMKLALELDEKLHEKYNARNKLFQEETLSTFEPTKVKANVDNVNTIPGVDLFYFDCRVLPEYSLEEVLTDFNVIAEKFKEEYGADTFVEPVSRDDAGPETLIESEVVKLAMRGIKFVTKKELRLVGIGGLTVANLFRKASYSAVVWSTINDIAHEPNEYCVIDNLINDTKVFATIPLMAD